MEVLCPSSYVHDQSLASTLIQTSQSTLQSTRAIASSMTDFYRPRLDNDFIPPQPAAPRLVASFPTPRVSLFPHYPKYSSIHLKPVSVKPSSHNYLTNWSRHHLIDSGRPQDDDLPYLSLDNSMADALDRSKGHTRIQWLSALDTEFVPKKNYRRTSIIGTIGSYHQPRLANVQLYL